MKKFLPEEAIYHTTCTVKDREQINCHIKQERLLIIPLTVDMEEKLNALNRPVTSLPSHQIGV